MIHVLIVVPIIQESTVFTVRLTVSWTVEASPRPASTADSACRGYPLSRSRFAVQCALGNSLVKNAAGTGNAGFL